MEKTTGPLFGFYVACYTIATSEGHFAYAKFFPQPAESAWDGQAAVRKLVAGPYPDPEAAIDAVMARAERRLARRQARISDWAVLDARTSQPGALPPI